MNVTTRTKSAYCERAGIIPQRIAPRERALLWLAYGEGRPHREIAGILDVAELSVRVLLFRARRKLAKILEERGLGPEAFA